MRIDDEHGDELEVMFLDNETVVELSVISGAYQLHGDGEYLAGAVLSKDNARKLIRRLERWLAGEPAVNGVKVLT